MQHPNAAHRRSPQLARRLPMACGHHGGLHRVVHSENWGACGLRRATRAHLECRVPRETRHGSVDLGASLCLARRFSSPLHRSFAVRMKWGGRWSVAASKPQNSARLGAKAEASIATCSHPHEGASEIQNETARTAREAPKRVATCRFVRRKPRWLPRRRAVRRVDRKGLVGAPPIGLQ